MRFGSEPRPGGGGGLLADGAADGVADGAAAGIDPDGGSGGGRDGLGADGAAAAVIVPDERVDWSVGGSGGGAEGVDPDGGAGGGAATGAGPGIPRSVFFTSSGAGRADETEPGGGGGAFTGCTEAVFFPRPSKMSRSDPPFLLSFDIRDS